jgi:hypothetical protein
MSRGNNYKSNFINKGTMAKAATYMKDIRAQVKADHGGKVPGHLNLTIRNYANALEIRDNYRDQILKDGALLYENGSMGQTIRKQHPLCGLLYQQEMLCLSYAKALGGTAAKAAAKPEDPGDANATDKLNEFISGIK